MHATSAAWIFCLKMSQQLRSWSVPCYLSIKSLMCSSVGSAHECYCHLTYELMWGFSTCTSHTAPKLRSSSDFKRASSKFYGWQRSAGWYRQPYWQITLEATDWHIQGLDIPDVMFMGQLGVLSLLTVQMQHAGRAGWTESIQACMVLFLVNIYIYIFFFSS